MKAKLGSRLMVAGLSTVAAYRLRAPTSDGFLAELGSFPLRDGP
jgi:hypothetical protein